MTGSSIRGPIRPEHASERGGVLWFFMSRSGRPVADLEEHPRST